MNINGTENQVESIWEDPQTMEQDLELDQVFQHGITMKEVSQLKSPTIQTLEEAILALKIGNARFFSGSRTPLTFSAIERRAQILTQNSFAVILGCSDS